MNIYTTDFIKSPYELTGIHYDANRSRHSESMYMTFKRETGSKESKHYFAHNIPLSSMWMQILDYDRPETVSSSEVFKILEGCEKQLPVNSIKDPRKLSPFLEKLTEERFDKLCTDILTALDEATRLRPALGFLYPLFHTILNMIYSHLMGDMPADQCTVLLATHLLSLHDQISALDEIYQDAKEYCDAVFMCENELGAEISPDKVSAIYHAYCIRKGIKDYRTDPQSGFSLTDFLIPNENISWKSYYESHRWEYLSSEADNKESYLISDLDLFLHIGIDQMLQAQCVLRTCKLCGGYFRIRYSSSQEYCTRLYRDTKAACNEYASRKSYKDKLFQHPIHQEFTKAYNKLYGRIRRGKLPADTPLMDQLKKLHDDYYEKYENTHQKNREAVWREYIEKNKELLA